MLSPIAGFTERDIQGFWKISVATNSGLALTQYASDTSPLTPTPYGNSFGTLAPGSVTTAGTIRETGWLLQPVTASGPSTFSVLASIYDESVAAGQTAGVLLSRSGNMVATDQYVTSGAGLINPGTATLDAACGIYNGQPRLVQAGDVSRLLFKGQVTQRATALAIFFII